MTVPALAGPALVAAAVLAVAGAAKVRSPDGTARALRLAGLPGSPAGVRAGAAAEVVVGAVALGWGAPVAHLAVGVSYLAFAAFVLVALRSATPLATCGCFGEADTPPTVAHVTVNAGLAAAALATATGGGAGIVDLLAGQPLAGLPMVVAFAAGAGAVIAVLTLLPRLQGELRARP